MNVEKLKDSFIGSGEVKGHKFTKVHQDDKNYIYRVETGNRKYFEVFKKRSRPKVIDFLNRVFSEDTVVEGYPKSNSFGINAWTCPTIEDCKKHL